MDWTLELVVVPVSDVDRAKAFYSDQVGFAVDHDTPVSDEMRVVQLTPPGPHVRSRSAQGCCRRRRDGCRACNWSSTMSCSLGRS